MSVSLWVVKGLNRGACQGRIQDFKLGGAHLKKNCAERREARNCLGYFVSKITILRQKIIFLPIAEGGTKMFGVFRLQNRDFAPKNHIFSKFREGAPPPPGSAPACTQLNIDHNKNIDI